MLRRVSALILLPLVGLPFVGVSASAGTLKGTLVFPPSARQSDDRPLAHWRLENGILAIAPAANEPRRDVVLALDPEKLPPPRAPGSPPNPIVIELKPLKLEPRVTVGEVGATLQVRNSDRGPRTVFLKDGASFMPPEATAPGASREVKFTVAGEYQIVDADNPRVASTVVITPSPYFAHADDRGGFSVELPEGRYSLRAYYRGAWTEPQPIDVGRTHDVTVRLPASARAAATSGSAGPREKR